MNKRPLTDKDGEVRPLTLKDFKRFRTIREVDPGMIEAAERFKSRTTLQKRPEEIIK